MGPAIKLYEAWKRPGILFLERCTNPESRMLSEFVLWWVFVKFHQVFSLRLCKKIISSHVVYLQLFLKWLFSIFISLVRWHWLCFDGIRAECRKDEL